MYRFHPGIKLVAQVLVFPGVVAVGMAVPAMAATGSMHAPVRAEPAAGGEEMAHSPATDALNLLESKGYGDFDNFHRDGRMYAVTVTRDGKTMHLIIDPESGKIEKRDS
jgi:hypothetical protein